MLNLNIPTIVFQIFNFLVLSFLLYRFLFRPVMKNVREHAEQKLAMEKATQEKLEDAERLRSELEERLQAANEEVQGIVNDAQDRLEDIHKVLVASARKEADRILKEAHLEARQLQQKAMQDHKKELLKSIREISGQIIRTAAPAEIQNRFVEQLNQRIWQLGNKEMDQVETIRRSLDERSPTVFVESAHELSIEHRQELMQTLTALVDRDVELDLRTKPDLFLGLRVRVGDTVINNTIASHLDEIMQDTEGLLEERMSHV